MNEVFRVGFANRWERRDPRTGLNYASFLVQWHVYEPPYHLVPESKQVRSALLEYPLQQEANGGSLTWSARVVPGSRFSDGTELTAEHVAASLERTAAFKAQASASAHGDKVFFRLKRPHARFELLLARFDLCIVLERGGELLGTGPYMFNGKGLAECFRLVRNPHSKEAPKLGEIEFRVYPLDAAGRRQNLLDAVNRGEVDFTDELAREELNRVERMRKCIDLGYCTAILFFNSQRPLLQDSRVRHALASAIDRKKLAAQSYSNALAFAATGMLPPSLGSTPDLITHDLDRARDLLAQASVKPSTPLVLCSIPVPRPYLPDPRATAQLIAAQLGELGFKVEIKQLRDLAEYQEVCTHGSYDLLLAGWIPDTSDPLDFMQSLLATDSIPAKTNQASRGSNFSRWRNPNMDRELEKQRTQPEPATWRTICEMVKTEVPLFPLMYGPRIAVVSWRARNFPRQFSSGAFLSQVDVPAN